MVQATNAIVATLLIIMTIVSVDQFISSKQEIFPAESGKAVYIVGKSCTINTDGERSAADLTKDFEHCLKVHQRTELEFAAVEVPVEQTSK